jgi:hypothetical protein
MFPVFLGGEDLTSKEYMILDMYEINRDVNA